MLIYRLNNGVPLLKPAHSICPACHERLHWFELIPVFSFCFLRGRCASCGGRIPGRYLYLELAFVGTALAIAGTRSLALWPPQYLWPQLALCWFIWAMIFSDLLYREIPVVFSLGFILLLWIKGLQGAPSNLLVWLILFLLIKGLEKWHYRRPVFGGADFLLFGALAFYFEPARYILSLYLAFLGGLLVALGLLITRRAGRESLIPFAPCILLAFAVVDLWGGVLTELYARWYVF